MTNIERRIRLGRLALVGLIVSVLGADVLVVGDLSNRAVPVRVTTIVQRYRQRATAADLPTRLVAAASGTPQDAAAPTAPPAAQPRSAHPPVVPARAPAPRPWERPPSAPGGPPPGVYVYATSGHEEVSVMGGSRHDYPAQTTITVTATTCGRDLRWDALTERWDDIATCIQGSEIDAATYTTHHEFFGVHDQRTYTCPPGTSIRPANTTPGTATKGRCVAPGAKQQSTPRLRV